MVMNDITGLGTVPLSGLLEFIVLFLEQGLIQLRPGISEHYALRSTTTQSTMRWIKFLRTLRRYHIMRQ
jgi:hypothetical protein